MRGFAVASVVLCACLVCAAAVEHRVVIDYSVPPRPAASPEDASDSLEQRVHELEALALDQGIVFNQEVIRLLASLQFLKAQPAVEYSGALLAAHDTADRYMQQCAPTFAECGLASAHASSAEVAANDAAGADDEMDLGDLRDRLLHTPRAQRRCLSSDWDAVPKPCVRTVFSLARIVRENGDELSKLVARNLLRPHKQILSSCQSDLRTMCGIDVSHVVPATSSFIPTPPTRRWRTRKRRVAALLMTVPKLRMRSRAPWPRTWTRTRTTRMALAAACSATSARAPRNATASGTARCTASTTARRSARSTAGSTAPSPSCAACASTTAAGCTATATTATTDLASTTTVGGPGMCPCVSSAPLCMSRPLCRRLPRASRERESGVVSLRFGIGRAG